MRVTEVAYGKAMTINLGNYQSARIEVRMVAEVEKGDDETEIMNGLIALVDEYMEQESNRVS